ncbi:MAG: MAPEG family protein [Parasphingorhabdus sp.]
MTIPIYAAAAGAFLIILQALLMVTVGAYRGKSGISLGVGDDPALERKIRRHGNLAENAGLFVAVLALAEMTVVPNIVVQYIAIAFIVARIFHAIALSSAVGAQGDEGSKFFIIARVIGAMGTFLSFLTLGGYILTGLL